MFEEILQVQKKLYAQHLLSPTELAKTLAVLGQNKEAMHYLNLAYEQHDSSLIFVDDLADFENLRGDADYRDLLARLNLPLPGGAHDPNTK